MLTWNAGAAKPADLRHDEEDANFFRDLLNKHEAPDIIIFGLQELVDLDDKKLTASECAHVLCTRLQNGTAG